MSAVSDLVERAESMGANFTLTEDSVKVTASGPLPPELMSELREHKAEIIGHLRQRAVIVEPPVIPSPATPPPSQADGGPTEPPVGLEGIERSDAFEQLRRELSGPEDVPQATPVAPSPGPEISPAPSQPSSPPDESTPLPDPRPSVEVEEPSSQPSVAPAQEGDEFDDEDEAPVDGRRSLFGGLGRLTSGLTRLSGRKAKETASITVEHGSVKLLITRGLEVVDHTIVDANQRLFREGLVSDAARLSGLVEDELGESLSRYRHVVSAVPGYQTTTRRLDLPNAKGMDPKVIIPQEAQRKLGISAEHSYLTWHKLPSSIDKSQWLIMSATNRSTASLGATTGQLGMDLVALELRSFSLARAVNQADAVIAWTAPDGCDAVVVRSWMPITHQTAYWGTAASIEASDLVNRVTEVVESTIAAHDVSNPEMAVAEDIPIYITGSPVGSDDTIAARVANNTRHPLRQPEPPIHIPEGFPLHDLIINVGLALRGV